MIVRIANNFTPELANGNMIPIERCSNDRNGSGSGINVFIVCENINATAATEAVPIIVKSVHPNKKEKKLPKHNRRYSYTPPDSSVNDDKPDNINAPNSVMIPAIIHAPIIQFSLKPVFAMGMIFLYTPEPIIIPATNNILVNNPKALRRGILVLSVKESYLI